MEVGGRVLSGTSAESNAGARLQDVGGRAAPGASRRVTEALRVHASAGGCGLHTGGHKLLAHYRVKPRQQPWSGPVPFNSA
jgi:hypothetical protein